MHVTTGKKSSIYARNMCYGHLLRVFFGHPITGRNVTVPSLYGLRCYGALFWPGVRPARAGASARCGVALDTRGAVEQFSIARDPRKLPAPKNGNMFAKVSKSYQGAPI
jgi:hypothetical protein